MTSHDSTGSMSRVTDRAHAWIQEDATWWINNTGVLVGERCSLIVDTCATDRRTRAFLGAVEQLDAPPVRWAVNTHAHGDHTYGNALLSPDVALVGHQAMRAHLATDPVFDACPPLWEPVPDWGLDARRVPEVGLTGALAVDLGDHEVLVVHPGYPAHTAGDLVVWSEAERVLYAGDLIFHGLTPLVFMGSVAGARRSLEWIAGFEPAAVVPGHGPIVTEDVLAGVLAEHDEYYRLVESLAAEGLRSDRSPADVARTADLGRFADWADAERLVPNLHRAYADVTGEEVEIIPAMQGAVDWLGHPMHTSV